MCHSRKRTAIKIMVTFFSKYIPNVSTRFHHIHGLLQNGVSWNRTNEHQLEFDAIKNTIANSKKLAIFYPKEKVVVITDTSPYGTGVQLCNIGNQGELKTVSCA